MPNVGEFMDPEDIARLQILLDVEVRLGSALMTSRSGGEVAGSRGVILTVNHRTNQSSADPVTTLFGLDQDTLMGVTGTLLATIWVHFGQKELATLLHEVGAYVDTLDPDVGGPR